MDANKVCRSLLSVDSADVDSCLFDVLPVGCLMWDGRLNLVSANTAMAEKFGYASGAEFIDNFNAVLPIVQPCGLMTARKLDIDLEHTLDIGTCQSQWVFRPKGGTEIYMDISLKRVGTRGLSSSVVVGTFHDITDTKTKQPPANPQPPITGDDPSASVISLAQAAPVAVCFSDPSANILSCNDVMLKLLSLPNQEEYKQGFYKLSQEYQPDGTPSRSGFLELIQQALEKGTVHTQWTYLSPRGELIPTEKILVKITLAGEAIIAIYTNDKRNIHVSKAHEWESFGRIQAFYDKAPFIVNFFSDSTVIGDCNQEALKIFDIPSKEEYIMMYGRLSPDRQPCGRPSDQLSLDYVYQALNEGSVKYEWMHQKLDGTPIPCEIILMRMFISGSYIVVGYVRDIRDYKASAARAEDYSRRMRLAFDTIPLAVIFWDDNARISRCNSETVQLFGLTSKEEVSEKFTSLSPKNQPCGTPSEDLLKHYLAKTLEEGQTNFQWLHTYSDKTPIPCHVIMKRVMGKSGYTVVSYTRDIRDLEQANRKREEVDSHLRLLMENLPIGLELWGLDNDIQDCNLELARMLGVTNKAQLMGRYFEYSAPVQTSNNVPAKDYIRNCIQKAQQEGSFITEWDYISSTGDTIPCEATYVSITYRGEPFVLCYARDLRVLKELTANLNNAVHCLDAIIEGCPVACYRLDHNLSATDCNAKALELLGFAQKQEGINCFTHILPKEQKNGQSTQDILRKNLVDTITDGYAHAEVLLQKTNGEALPCNIIMLKQDDQSVVMYIHDLREARQIQHQLELLDAAEEKSQAKTRFLARMSHEIRTPISSILGVADMQLLREDISAETEHMFGKVHTAASALLRIINDILDLSKIEAGEMDLLKEPYEITDLVRDLVQLNLGYLSGKNLAFNLQIDPDLPKTLTGDELRIKQLLSNLLSNAIKYTPSGSVDLHIYTAPGSEPERPILGAKISDTGTGMTKQQLDKLFDEYSRFNVQDNRNIVGTGLGMSIVRNLVQLLDAKINVNSEVGKGTEFTVLIPQQSQTKEVVGKKAAASLKNPASMQAHTGGTKRTKITREYMPYGKVLVVDDLESNLFVAKGLLQPYGLDINTVTSGAAAIAAIRAGLVYDLILMDHLMPDLDGEETAAAVAALGCDTPVVALTANALAGQADALLKCGFSGFLSKPIDLRKLDDCLNKFICNKQPPNILEAARKHATDAQTLVAHDENISDKLAEQFLSDAAKAIAVLEAVSFDKAGDDLQPYALNMQSIKSMLAEISRKDLAEIAHHLGQCAESGSVEVLALDTPAFLTELRRVVDELASLH